MKILAGTALNRRYRFLKTSKRINNINIAVGIAATAGSAACQSLPLTLFWISYTLLNKIVNNRYSFELLEKYKPEFDKISERAKRIARASKAR